MTTVAYDHQIFCEQEFGGISRYICELGVRVARHDTWHSVVVAPLHFNDYLARSSIDKMGWYLPKRLGRVGRLCRIVSEWSGPAILRMTRPDIVHRTYYMAKPRPPHGKLVVTVHDMIHELFPHYFATEDPTSELKRRSVEQADHVICVSHNTASDLMRLLGTPPHKVSVAHHGHSNLSASLKAPSEASIRMARPYFLFVGQRGAYKNFARVLIAYSASSRLQADFDLLAFGGGKFTKPELAQIEKLAFRPDAVRHAAGTDEDLSLAYANAHALVYPSEYEGFGLPPLEAMSYGCPVACSDTSCLPEVVGDAGEYFDPASVDAIRFALERLSDDSNRRQGLLAAGLERSRQFSWDRCTSETIRAYSKTMQA